MLWKMKWGVGQQNIDARFLKLDRVRVYGCLLVTDGIQRCWRPLLLERAGNKE